MSDQNVIITPLGYVEIALGSLKTDAESSPSREKSLAITHIEIARNFLIQGRPGGIYGENANDG